MQHLRDLFQRPEPAQTVEVGERRDQFGLVVIILVIRVQGAQRWIAEHFLGPRLAWMRLDRQRLSGGKHLEQPWQPVLESLRNLRAQDRGGGAANQLLQVNRNIEHIRG